MKTYSLPIPASVKRNSPGDLWKISLATPQYYKYLEEITKLGCDLMSDENPDPDPYVNMVINSMDDQLIWLALWWEYGVSTQSDEWVQDYYDLCKKYGTEEIPDFHDQSFVFVREDPGASYLTKRGHEIIKEALKNDRVKKIFQFVHDNKKWDGNYSNLE